MFSVTFSILCPFTKNTDDERITLLLNPGLLKFTGNPGIFENIGIATRATGAFAEITAYRNKELQEHYLMTVNEFYNKDWANIAKHPKLQWLTLTMCSHESKKPQFHEWIPLKKEKDKKVEFLADLFPNMKRADVETLATITTDKEIKQYCEGLGWDKKTIHGIKL
jgi:hypothetical protein